MITGIVTTDKTNCFHLIPDEIMRSPLTSSYWFLRGICEDGYVVADQHTWRKLSKIHEIPLDVPVFINIDPSIVQAKFPLIPITLVGTEMVERHLLVVDKILHVKYKHEIMVTCDKTFPFPNVKPRLMGTFPNFDLYEYVIKDDINEFANANPTFSQSE